MKRAVFATIVAFEAALRTSAVNLSNSKQTEMVLAQTEATFLGGLLGGGGAKPKQ